MRSCSAAEEVFIIGGESVYREALPLADRLCLTLIDAVPERADAFFPQVSEDEWRVESREEHDTDEKHSEKYTFVDYIRHEAIS